MTQKKCGIWMLAGLIISAAAAVVLGVLVDTTALKWLKYFIIAVWILTAVSIMGLLVQAGINLYNENRRNTKMLGENIALLFIGSISAIIATAVLTLLSQTGGLTDFALKFLTAVTAFSAGLVLTADLCYVYGIATGCRRRYIVPAPCEDEETDD